MVTVAVVGIGYWGKHLLRNLDAVADVRACVHRGDSANREWVREHYEHVAPTTEFGEVLDDDRIDAVAIATPIDTHVDIARRALEEGKHVFVEKPLATSPAAAGRLVELAESTGRRLFVGYVFVHHPLIQALDLERGVDRPGMGRFQWRKLGAFDTDVVFDLVVHPISVATYLFGDAPSDVRVHSAHTVVSSTDVIGLTLEFDDGRTFDVDIDRVAPESHKSMVISIDETAYTWTEETLYRFDPAERSYEAIEHRDREPLAAECKRFVASVEGDAPPITDGEFGAQVTAVAADVSERLAALT